MCYDCYNRIDKLIAFTRKAFWYPQLCIYQPYCLNKRSDNELGFISSSFFTQLLLKIAIMSIISSKFQFLIILSFARCFHQVYPFMIMCYVITCTELGKKGIVKNISIYSLLSIFIFPICKLYTFRIFCIQILLILKVH